MLVERLRAVAAGDSAALQAVYDLTSAKLFGICLRILGDREEAEDVLQDVYLIIWRKADRFDTGRASPITWLATIARNRSIDRLRQIGPRRADRPVDGEFEIADDGPDAFEMLLRAEEGHRLAECLDALDARARGAITSAFFGGATYETLAGDAGVPLGTMKSLIRRGLQKLKGCLSQ
ncbi:sigma-70 family RNA polymerase sigma factor [Aurantimonas sp. A2-1-M11]